MLLIFLIHFCCTFYMLGLIWFVQVVHYPLLNRVTEDFPLFMVDHARLTSYVVVPAMLGQLITAALLLFYAADVLSLALLWANLGLELAAFAVTFLLAVPCHEKLQQAYDQAIHRRLVRSNTWRTLIWCVRAALVAYLAYVLFTLELAAKF